MSELTKYPSAPLIDLAAVEWRADSDAFSRTGGASCRWVPHLTYSKCAQLMDDWVGPNNWRIDGYKEIAIVGTVGYSCQVSVRFVDGGEWVPRQSFGDVGDGLHTIKGTETDAFKRTVGRAWGCGRNVYDMPTLWAACRSDPKKTNSKTGNMKALGATRDTTGELESQLKELGFATPSARISMETEGPDEHGEGPHGRIVPDTDPDDEVAAATGRLAEAFPGAEAAPSQPEAPVERTEAVSGVSEEPEPLGMSLPEMMGRLKGEAKPCFAELKKEGLWPVGNLARDTAEWAKAAGIISAHLNADKAVKV